MSQDKQTAQETQGQPEEVRAAPWKVLFETGSGVDPSGTSPWDLRHAGVHSWQPPPRPAQEPATTKTSLPFSKDALAAAREKEGARKDSEETPSCPRSSPLGMGVSDTLPSTRAGSQGTRGKAVLGHHAQRVLHPPNHPQHCLSPREPSPALSQATGRGTRSTKALPAWCGEPPQGWCSGATGTGAFTPL